jgi:tagatose-1,6-bisphosphate aldolase
LIAERSLRPIAGPAGVICLLALDHREAMRNVFRRAGIENVTAEEMLETKLRIVEAVAPAATGVLLDHAAARAARPEGIGLLVPLEEQGHEQLDGARLNRLEFTAEAALRLGADGCKLVRACPRPCQEDLISAAALPHWRALGASGHRAFCRCCAGGTRSSWG